jgi:hypothetical protein
MAPAQMLGHTIFLIPSAPVVLPEIISFIPETRCGQSPRKSNIYRALKTVQKNGMYKLQIWLYYKYKG